ncbi:ATP-dependent RNA helicase-like protein DB10 [Sesamum indicum]|uniref:RNA helicase n=1 Tax=Sesamum indicum TaxID=4182 RepID=A0A6I9UI88_SESIN|nr:ATP-dependent RNA helicase-like protein DB10 [Sesamum indicum]
MAATATGIRYAPEDPTLPKPWKGLVDDTTGYLYYWNPETNITQYERPVASSHASSTPSHKFLSSSVQKSPQGRRSNNGDDDRYIKTSNGGPTKVASGAGNYQTARSRSDYLQIDADVKTSFGYGSYAAKDAENGLSAESYRRQHEISVTGDNVPQPFSSFQVTGFPSEILREVQHAGFSAPTPIQAQSWPIALQGRDIVAIAKTGSGKTLGYLIPGFIHLKQRRNNPRLGPTVLVLAPTRELATQIQDEAVKFGRSSKISCTCLYGGAPKGPQLKDLDRGVDVVVATPGRLNDILEMRKISLHQVSYLVLDEADRMLDMGFEPQIRKIVKEVPSRRQTLMYTATWPKEVRRIAADLLVNPAQVNIGNVDELAANKAITQYVEVLSPMDKRRRLEQILRSQEPGSKIIIFCSTKKMCDQLAGNLTRQFGAAAIHGDKSQGERDHVLNQFRTGRSPVLVATDVAARGLDIKDIRVVINYDFPTGVEDYVHRIGRTGRAGATGVAYTFFCDQDAKHASDLVKVLEGANQNVPVELRNMASRGGGMGRARRQWGSGPGGRDGGRGGRYDTSYGGRDGGRTGWGMSSIPAKGVNRGYERDRHGSGTSDGQDTIGFHYKSFHESVTATAKNRGRSRSRSRSPNRNSGWGERHGKTRSRSRSRSRSPYRSSGWGDKHGKTRSHSRSRSSERFNGAAPTRKSFHESVMEGVRASPSKHARAFSYGNPTSKDYKNYDNLKVVDGEKSLSPRVNEKGTVRGSNNSAAEKRRRSPPRQSTGYEEFANGLNSNFRDEEEDGMLPPEDNGLFRPPN